MAEKPTDKAVQVLYEVVLEMLQETGAVIRAMNSLAKDSALSIDTRKEILSQIEKYDLPPKT